MNPLKMTLKVITAPVIIPAAIVADGIDTLSGNFIGKPTKQSVTGKTIDWIVEDDDEN